MAVKGIQAKADITKRILETFDGSFMNDKEIRIPVMENGEEVQIKVTLTAAKVNIDHAATLGMSSDTPTTSANVLNFTDQKTEPSADEKAKVKELMAMIGL